ncbi:MAG: hypothetical protein MSA35_07105 [Prevotella sp.]|nr:hypothetical protein [Prevotella sp.]
MSEKNKLVLLALILSNCAIASESTDTLSAAVSSQCLDSLWQSPSNDYRMKTWWFFGYGPTTSDGISADVRSFSDAGFGGVVYYDQNHARNSEANGAEPGFSPSWWSHLKHAASEAQRYGLSFEMNISNGYVAGGRWISPRHAMQRVTSAMVSRERCFSWPTRKKPLSLPL